MGLFDNVRIVTDPALNDGEWYMLTTPRVTNRCSHFRLVPLESPSDTVRYHAQYVFHWLRAGEKCTFDEERWEFVSKPSTEDGSNR